MAAVPEIDLASPLQFVINAAAGSSDAQAKREVVEAAPALVVGEVTCCSAAPRVELRGAAGRAGAFATRTAVVAVGGDGTLNTVAQAAHAAGCAMGVVPQGTFNYFARTHRHSHPPDPRRSACCCPAAPVPVLVGRPSTIGFSWSTPASGSTRTSGRPRGPTKPRFGRSRWVAFVAACATLLRAQRKTSPATSRWGHGAATCRP